MATSKDVIKSFTIKVNTKDGKVKIDGISKSFEDAEKAFDGLQNKMKKGLPEVSAQMDGITRSSGGAAASVTEFGRVISDAPYGIRGVANNLSQLASNLALTAKKAGGFGAAMKSLGAAFMGPLGILVGIQAGLALLEAWSMRAKEADISTTMFKDTVSEGVAKIALLDAVLSDTEITLSDKKDTLKLASDDMAQFGIDTSNATDDLVGFQTELRNTIDRLIDVAIANNILKEFQTTLGKIAEASRNDAEDNLAWYQKAWLIYLNGTEATAEEMGKVLAEKGEKQRAKTLDKLNKTIEDLMAEFKEKGKSGETFYKLVWGDEEDARGGGRRARKIFKQGVLDLQKIILANRKALAKDAEKYQLDIIKVQGQFAQDDIDLRLETFKEKQAIRLRDYLASIKGHRDEAQLTADAQAKYKESVIDAETEAGEAKLAIRANYAQKYRLKEEEILQRQRTGVATDSLGRLADAEALADPFAADANNELVEARRQARLRDIDDRLKDERVGTDAYYAILKERLDFVKQVNQEEYQSELDKIAKKKQINMEYADFLATSASILRNIAGENEAMQKLALVVEKGAAVAKVVIGAQASIEARKAQHNAIPSFINVPSPTGMISIPNPAKAADKAMMLKANLMTKVGAGLSIANILSQTLKKKGSIKDGGGKDAGGGREFDFNLVGSTGENQLAQATAGQLNQPVQAYVVSSEITSQQQLDNTIQTNASFGDED